MKKKIVYALLVALWVGNFASLSAQNKVTKLPKQRPAPEQLMQMQVNQMVGKLMLDDATAAKFVPVYEQYLTEQRDCRMMCRKQKMVKEAENGTVTKGVKPALTDAEIEAMLKNRFTQSRKMLDIREKYYREFSKILSQKQILKIYQQEKMNVNQFRREVERRKGMKPRTGRLQGPRACERPNACGQCPYVNR